MTVVMLLLVTIINGDDGNKDDCNHYVMEDNGNEDDDNGNKDDGNDYVMEDNGNENDGRGNEVMVMIMVWKIMVMKMMVI